MTSAQGDRIWTIPNLISIARLACVPVYVWLLKGEDRPLAAAALLAVLGATDWIDGYIARRFDQGSELGKVLDPLADRVLLVTAAITLLGEGLPAPMTVVVVVVLVRGALIAAVTVGLAAAGARRIEVIWAGKAGTLAIMFALPLFLGAEFASEPLATLCAVAGWVFAIGGIALGWYAAAKYVPEARVALHEGRAARVDSRAEEVAA